MRYLVAFAPFILFGSGFSDAVELKNANSGEIEPYAIIASAINSTIESIRSSIPDTIQIEELDLTTPEEIANVLEGSVGLSNFELTGLNKFQVPFLNYAIIGARLNFTFVLPSINISTAYLGDLLLAKMIPFYGSGKANIHIGNIEIQGSARVDLSNISVENLRIQLYTGEATFDIQADINDEDFNNILSSLLTDVVDSFINNHQKFVSNTLSPLIEGLLNPLLVGADMKTLVIH